MEINEKAGLTLNQKQFQIYELNELINKIQDVINTESLLPKFIYFVKNVEEMRKKWNNAEQRCKELENKLTYEKSIYQRRINELKIDIEEHNEKRLQAEMRSDRLQAELDKLLKQFDQFKDILQSDKRSYAMYSDLASINNYDFNNQMSSAAAAAKSPFKSQQNSELNIRRLSTRGGPMIEDTCSFNISDYTEDDIDMADNEHEHNIPQVMAAQPSSISLQNQQTERQGRQETTCRKKTQQRYSVSLTRNDERTGGGARKKRSRTRSTDVKQQQQQQQKEITAITTLKIDADGRPITISSEIKHNQSPDRIKHQQTQISSNSNKMEMSFSQQQTNQNKNNNNKDNNNNNGIKVSHHRKKRPSREFLQKSADESESTEDSEIFWNGSDAVIDELNTQQTEKSGSNMNRNYNVHIMTPIVETITPTVSGLTHKSKRQLIASSSHQTNNSNQQQQQQQQQQFKTKTSIPLARKYKRSHVFKSQVILNSELCAHCEKRTKFGKMIMKCRECDMVVHNECKDLLQRPCYPFVTFPAQGTITDYVNLTHPSSIINHDNIAQSESSSNIHQPHVPPILQMLISEIESRGLLTHEIGLYRVNGSDSQIKQLKERLIKRHQPPDLRKIADVHVLCSFVKDFLNNFLTEHLITYDAWYRFAKACDIQNESERSRVIQEAIVDLPQANRDTLAFIILHLQRISETPECKMPASNLARVFGPSIVGNSSPNLPAPEIINELRIQHQIVENLIKISSSFYLSFIDEPSNHMTHQQRLFKPSNTPMTPSSNQASKTPDLLRKSSKTAVVLSSILGPATNLQTNNFNNKY